jgi:hypothetical protein
MLRQLPKVASYARNDSYKKAQNAQREKSSILASIFVLFVPLRGSLMRFVAFVLKSMPR